MGRQASLLNTPLAMVWHGYGGYVRYTHPLTTMTHHMSHSQILIHSKAEKPLDLLTPVNFTINQECKSYIKKCISKDLKADINDLNIQPVYLPFGSQGNKVPET